jgi:hypothetical protein
MHIAQSLLLNGVFGCNSFCNFLSPRQVYFILNQRKLNFMLGNQTHRTVHRLQILKLKK